MQRSPRDEQGSTLIELLIATMISIALIAVVAMTFTMGQRTNANTGTLLSESNDAQLVATYLPADLQSVSPAPVDVVIGNSNLTNPNPTQNGPSSVVTGCSPEPANDADHFNALRLNWTQPNGTAVRTSYRIEKVGTAAAPGWQLVRYSCTSAAPAPSAIVVARNLMPPVTPSTNPVCPLTTPSPFPVPAFVTACTGDPVTGDPVALKISMTLTDVSGYSYVVSGGRRTPQPPAGVLDHFLVNVPDSATVGAPFDVTVTAQDVNNYTVVTDTGAITIGSTLAATSTFVEVDQGVHTFSMTVNATGTTTISATRGPITGSATPLTVNPLVLDHFNIETPDTVTQNAPFSVKVTAQDSRNVTVTTYTGTVIFFITSPDAGTIPSSYTFVAGDTGVRTFNNLSWSNVTPLATLNVRDSVAPAKTGIATFAVVPGAATGPLALTTTTPSPTAGSTANVTVTAKTVSNTTDTGYRGTVTFTSNDAQATLPANYTFTAADNGVHTFTNVTLRTAGTLSVTATDTVNTSRTGSVSYTVGIASPITITLVNCKVNGAPVACGTSFNVGGTGGTFTANVRAADPFGNPPASASISSDDGDFVVSGSPVAFTGGNPVSQTTFTVTHTKNGNGSATITISAGGATKTYTVRR